MKKFGCVAISFECFDQSLVLGDRLQFPSPATASHKYRFYYKVNFGFSATARIHTKNSQAAIVKGCYSSTWWSCRLKRLRTMEDSTYVAQMSSSNVVQMVYELCNETFTPSAAPHITPVPEAIQRLTSLLDTVKPIDLGLDEKHSTSSSSTTAKRRRERSRSGSGDSWTPPVTYIHIHDCQNFSMGIFCLPRSAIIPLHDHRGMTVVSKLLYGTMHVKSYDWFDPISNISNNSNHQYSHPPGLRLAELKSDGIIRAPYCESSVLYPTTGGNIHSFTAVTSCAVLDVLAPPYREDPACYRVFPSSTRLLRKARKSQGDIDHEGFVWLEEVEKPDNFILKGKAYPGPIINVI